MQGQQEPHAAEWPRVYAEGTAILMENHLMFGAEGMFQTAVTHGLLAVVAQEWPGDHLRADRKTKSANTLIEWLKDRCPANGAVYTIRDTYGVNSPEQPGGHRGRPGDPGRGSGVKRRSPPRSGWGQFGASPYRRARTPR